MLYIASIFHLACRNTRNIFLDNRPMYSQGVYILDKLSKAHYSAGQRTHVSTSAKAGLGTGRPGHLVRLENHIVTCPETSLNMRMLWATSTSKLVSSPDWLKWQVLECKALVLFQDFPKCFTLLKSKHLKIRQFSPARGQEGKMGH